MALRPARFYDENDIERLAGTLDADGGVEAAPTYGGDSSFQTVAGDLNLEPAVGDNADTHFYAGGMFSVLGAALTKTKNYLGGVIGAYGLTGTKATTYPSGAVLAQVSDGVTEVDGAVVAYIDGDSAVTHADAMFKVRCNNSTPGSGADFGLDLQDASHDGYLPVDAAFYDKAPLRIVSDVVVLIGAGAPVNGTTGDNVAGVGSIYIDSTAGAGYMNTGALNNPAWTKFTP